MSRRASLLLYLLAAPVLAQDAHVHKVPFTVINHQPVLTLVINGKPRRMLLDTGSNATIFRKLIGTTGDALVVRGAIGDRLALNCKIIVEGIRLDAVCGVESLPSYQDGILGVDFLQHFKHINIDFNAKEIELCD